MLLKLEEMYLNVREVDEYGIFPEEGLFHVVAFLDTDDIETADLAAFPTHAEAAACLERLAERCRMRLLRTVVGTWLDADNVSHYEIDRVSGRLRDRIVTGRVGWFQFGLAYYCSLEDALRGMEQLIREPVVGSWFRLIPMGRGEG